MQHEWAEAAAKTHCDAMHVPQTSHCAAAAPPCSPQELLDAAKEQMGEAYRDDGPPLGFEFDDVPILPGCSELFVWFRFSVEL